MTSIWDSRWRGRFGIGRFAGEVRRRLSIPFIDFNSRIRPGSPLDPIALTYAQNRSSASLFVSPGYNVAFQNSGCVQVLTLHDLIHLSNASESSNLKRAYYERLVRPAVRRAGIVFTVSPSSREEIADWLSDDAVDIEVVGNGLSMPLASAPAERAARPFVLYVGNEKPHKNLPAVFGSVARLRLNLVTVGLSEERARTEALSAGMNLERLRVEQGLSDQALSFLYARADCLLFPSTLEGFGLPALEAMSQGTPTAYVCRAVGDVVGNLGYKSAGADAESFAAAVAEAVSAKGSAFPQLVERAATFTWDGVAERMEQHLVRRELVKR